MDLAAKHGLTGFDNADFHDLGMSVWSAKIPRTVIGIWDSTVMDGTEYMLSWRDATIVASLGTGEKVLIFCRTGATSGLSGTEWTGPSEDGVLEIDSPNRYVQIRLVVVGKIASIYPSYGGQAIGPTVSSLTVRGIASSGAALFFTKTFELGFCPEQIVLTKEADVPDGIILRFGVTSRDTVDLSEYQFIDAEKLVTLDQLAVTGTQIRFVIEMAGSSGDPVVVHEFAAMFSGRNHLPLNMGVEPSTTPTMTATATPTASPTATPTPTA